MRLYLEVFPHNRLHIQCKLLLIYFTCFCDKNIQNQQRIRHSKLCGIFRAFALDTPLSWGLDPDLAGQEEQATLPSSQFSSIVIVQQQVAALWQVFSYSRMQMLSSYQNVKQVYSGFYLEPAANAGVFSLLLLVVCSYIQCCETFALSRFLIFVYLSHLYVSVHQTKICKVTQR